MARCLDDLVELDDGRMPDEFENVDLAWDAFDIGDINNFFFDEDFDGDFFPSEGVGGHFDFAESAFADGFAEEVVADFLVLVGRLLIHMKQIS